MPKGITQEQVNTAVDALIAAGERPTVERVRNHLGTGSPNTVSRMLEECRRSLAQRFQEAIQLPKLPTEVGEAASTMWRQALAHAEAIARERLAQEQGALAAAHTALADERIHWQTEIASAQALTQSSAQARTIAETRLADVQRLVEQQTGQLAELVQQRDGWQQRAEQLAEAFDTHKSVVTADREAQAAHVRAVEDRAHAEIDRAREETKTLQTTLRQKERETSAVASRLETAEASARAAERLATEHGVRAKTLEQQLARMDGLPKALMAAQQSLQAALRREMTLQSKLDHLVTGTKTQPAARKRKSRKDPRAI